MASQIGQNLKQARENARLDQAEAAKQAGIHPMTLSRYERGVVAKVPGAVIIDLGRLYGVAPDELLNGKVSPASDFVPRGTDRRVSEAAVNPPFAPGRDGRNRLAHSIEVVAVGQALAASIARKLELFKREMVALGADHAEADYIDETFRRPETARLAHHDSDGKVLSDKQVEEQYDALIDGVRHIINRRIERRRKASKAK